MSKADAYRSRRATAPTPFLTVMVARFGAFDE
jgi:hypothetical protein